MADDAAKREGVPPRASAQRRRVFSSPERVEMMTVKLLIADRDAKERTGLEWLIQSYPVPFDRVIHGENHDSALERLLQEVPEVICIELDMIPRDRWDGFRQAARRYARRVIGITAEATFERAMQAIELGAVDLWVKPVSPDRVRRTLIRCYRELAESARMDSPPPPSASPAFSYRALFLAEEEAKPATLLLIQPETPEEIAPLHRFLQNYPFRSQPTLLPLSDAVVALFPRAGEETEQALHREAYRMINEGAERLGISLFVVLHPGGNALTLREQYQTARQALQLRFYRGDRQVVKAEQPVQWRELDPFLTPEEQQRWLEMLDGRNRDDAKNWMQHEFLSLTPPYPDPGLLRIRLTSILAQLRRFMKREGLNRDSVLENRYHQIFATVLYQPLLYRIVQDLLLFIYELFEAAEDPSRREFSDPVEQGVRYMEKEFHRPELSLKEVAEHVGRNPAYFSHLLSRQKKVTFRELLRTIRIRHACRLLASSSLSIQEIASRCGFPNANHFSRVFKEMTGTTPREYRNLKNRKGDKKEKDKR
jgi:two-component system response regulator YesN